MENLSLADSESQECFERESIVSMDSGKGHSTVITQGAPSWQSSLNSLLPRDRSVHSIHSILSDRGIVADIFNQSQLKMAGMPIITPLHADHFQIH